MYVVPKAVKDMLYSLFLHSTNVLICSNNSSNHFFIKSVESSKILSQKSLWDIKVLCTSILTCTTSTLGGSLSGLTWGKSSSSLSLPWSLDRFHPMERRTAWRTYLPHARYSEQLEGPCQYSPQHSPPCGKILFDERIWTSFIQRDERLFDKLVGCFIDVYGIADVMFSFFQNMYSSAIVTPQCFYLY